MQIFGRQRIVRSEKAVPVCGDARRRFVREKKRNKSVINKMSQQSGKFCQFSFRQEARKKQANGTLS